MRQLTREGRITVFKSLPVSKVIHLLLTTKISNDTTTCLYKIQKNFIWLGKTQKLNIVLFTAAREIWYRQC